MKKAFAVVLAIVLLIITTTSTLSIAIENKTSDKELDLHKIYDFVNNNSGNNMEYKFGTIKQLYSCTTNKQDYFYIELIPQGYAVTTSNSIVIEVVYDSPSVISPELFAQHIFYFGPSCFAIKDDENYVSIIDGLSVSDEMISSLIDFENRITQKSFPNSNEINSQRYGTTSVNVAYSYFTNLNDYGQNEGSTCTVVASCMLLGYYRHNVSTSYIDSQYVTQASSSSSSGTTSGFYDLICDYVYGTSPHNAIYISSASTGINNYLNTRYVNKDFYSTSGVGSTLLKLISLIDNYTPAIAATSLSHGATYNHTFLVYGYVYEGDDIINASSNNSDLSVGTYYFRVHYGWSNPSYNNALVISDWFYQCGYLE